MTTEIQIYSELLQDIKARIHQGQLKVASSISITGIHIFFVFN